MVVAVPLVVPAAQALLAAIAFVGSAIATGIGIGMVADAIDEEFSDEAPSSTKTCERTTPMSPPPPECNDILRRIRERVQELRQRHQEMLEDRHGLFPIRPNAKPPYGSWPGHIQQFDGKKINLAKLIAQAEALGCPVPPDANEWVKTPAPPRPLR